VYRDKNVGRATASSLPDVLKASIRNMHNTKPLMIF
jgi:hypothetical protein